MTNNEEFILQVEMWDSEGLYKQATYANFSVGPAPSYVLDIGGFHSDDKAFVRDALKSGDAFGFSSDGYDVDGDTTTSCAADWGNTAGW